MSTYSPFFNVVTDSGLFAFSTVFSSTQNIVYSSTSYDISSGMPDFKRGVNVGDIVTAAHSDIGMEYTLIKQGNNRLYIVWDNVNKLSWYVEYNGTIHAIGSYGNAGPYLNPTYFEGAYLLTVKVSTAPQYTQLVLFLKMRDSASSTFGCLASPQTNSYVPGFLDALTKKNVVDPYGTDENKTPPGGYGPHDYTSEQELPPGVPSISAADVGFISLWNPTANEIKALANWLWTGNFAINTWRAITADPMDCILSVGIIPIIPSRYQENSVDTKKEIEFAGSGSGVNSYRVTNQYYVVDMGTVHISGMSKSNMDYAPYAKASIFLPYCGTYALDVDEIMDANVSLEYHIDIYTGACVAYLTISGKMNSDDHEVDAVMYQFTGNCLATIPVTSVDHSQFIQSLLFMGASVAATVATAGGAGAAAAGADLGAEAGMSAGAIAATAGSAINTVMSMKPNVLHSGNLSSTAGFLGGQKPYITMTWSNLCRAEDEYKTVGMPLNKSGKLEDFKGLTVVSGVHLDNIMCTDTERIMIEQALYKGVIVPDGGTA